MDLPRLARKVRKSPTMVVRAALCSLVLPVWSRFRTIWRFPDQGGLTMVCEMVWKREQTSSSEEQRAARTTIAGDLRTFRANLGRDPSTKRPTRPPNSRDRAVRDAAFRTKTSRRWATLGVSNSVFYLCSDRFRSMGLSYFIIGKLSKAKSPKANFPKILSTFFAPKHVPLILLHSTVEVSVSSGPGNREHTFFAPSLPTATPLRALVFGEAQMTRW